MKILQKLFSIKNEEFHKVISIFGLKIKIKNYGKLNLEKMNNLENRLSKIESLFNNINSRFNGNNTTILSAVFQLAALDTAKYVIENMPKAHIANSTLELLTYALEQTSLDGLYLEFGVFSGNTINHISSIKKENTIYGFDSFKGLPETWRSGIEKGTFAKDELPIVNNNVTLVKGWFNETLPVFLEQHQKQCAFIHIDCDLYSSTKCIFDLLKKQIVPGTIIVFDEYFNYPNWQNGEFKAFQEFIKENKLSYEYIGYNQRHEQCAVKILAR